MRFDVVASVEKESLDVDELWWRQEVQLLKCRSCGRAVCYFAEMNDYDREHADQESGLDNWHLAHYAWIDGRNMGFASACTGYATRCHLGCCYCRK
jgi:hypothetical protein